MMSPPEENKKRGEVKPGVFTAKPPLRFPLVRDGRIPSSPEIDLEAEEAVKALLAIIAASASGIAPRSVLEALAKQEGRSGRDIGPAFEALANLLEGANKDPDRLAAAVVLAFTAFGRQTRK